MPEYTLMTLIGLIAVVSVEVFWFRTGIFRTAQYWWSMAIVLVFQIPVDGYLTRLADPIVVYNKSEMLGIRVPWDIPVEDFGFGFAMVTLVILLWRRRTAGKTSGPAAVRGAPTAQVGTDQLTTEPTDGTSAT